MDYYDSTGRYRGWYNDDPIGYGFFIVKDTWTDERSAVYYTRFEAEYDLDVTFRGAA